MNQVVRGSLAGLIATGAMSAVVAGGWATGFLRTPPPKHITGRIQDEIGIRHKLPNPLFESSWMLAHIGYGSGAGVAYTLARRLLPRSSVVAGLLFGGAVWAISYLGLMPGLHLYLWPDEDTKGRQGTMIAAHAVYGVTLAESERLLRGSNKRSRPHGGQTSQVT